MLSCSITYQARKLDVRTGTWFSATGWAGRSQTMACSADATIEARAGTERGGGKSPDAAALRAGANAAESKF